MKSVSYFITSLKRKNKWPQYIATQIEGYYIKQSFRQGNHLIHTTYQVTPEGSDFLQSIKMCKDGERISDNIFETLRRAGWIFTGKSGANAEIIEESLSEYSKTKISKSTKSEHNALAEVATGNPDQRVKMNKEEIQNEMKRQLKASVDPSDLSEQNDSDWETIENRSVPLSKEANDWISKVILCHPSLNAFPPPHTPSKITLEIPKELNPFIKQLTQIAVIFDGTDFFKQLENSCDSPMRILFIKEKLRGSGTV